MEMGNYEVVQATDKDLDFFYEDWSLTVEGLSTEQESLDDYYDVLSEFTALKPDFKFFVIEGWLMNLKYGLTGTNAYPDHCHIVVAPNGQFEDIGKVAIPRFAWGGRWFNDIVDNNAVRQREIRGWVYGEC
jgi:hypothetical protein